MERECVCVSGGGGGGDCNGDMSGPSGNVK